MPEVEYTTTMSLPVETVWDFVKDMNNWAPFLTGYQKHEMLSETDSVWTLKGDVGILSRVVELKVHVTEWNGPERVSFELVGLNEEVEGGGTLVMLPDASPALPPPRKSWLRRVFDALFRVLLRPIFGGKPAHEALPAARAASRLSFTLRMEAGGVTGPLVNAMLGPAIELAAEDLAKKIAAHLEKLHGR
jgi:carbon monoxide dehydrogenase subunit G